MSTICIVAYATSPIGDEYESLHNPPEVTQYIETDETFGGHYSPTCSYYVVDTTNIRPGRFPDSFAPVTAAAFVNMHCGDLTIRAPFICFEYSFNGKTQVYPHRQLLLRRGESGLFKLIFGFAAMDRPLLQQRNFDHKVLDRIALATTTTPEKADAAEGEKTFKKTA